VILKESEALPNNYTFTILTRDIHGLSSTVSMALFKELGLDKIRMSYFVASSGLLKIDIHLLEQSHSITLEICSSLCTYKRIALHPAFLEYLIVNSSCEVESFGEVHRLSDLDKCIIRYLEYCEFYWTAEFAPEHLQHILPETSDRQAFFEVLHRYTQITSPGLHPTEYADLQLAVHKWSMLKRIFYELPIFIQNFIRRTLHSLQ
jgi:hypothetical protein